MKKRLLITIDTEMDADTHWIKGYPRTYTSITEGIPRFYRPLWNKYGVNPIYFVSPEVLDDGESCVVLKSEIENGAIIGAHLHPDFIEPEMTPYGEPPLELFPCNGYDYDTEKRKIENLKDKIKKRLGVTPVWYRAARFGADEDTIKILAELGFKHDSSYTPGINWKTKGGPDHSLKHGMTHIVNPFGIIEHPITIIGKRGGIIGRVLPDTWLFYRWLRPTHMTFLEEKRIIDDASRSEMCEIVLMFHSMEVMINKTPYVRSAWMQRYFMWRLEKTINYAKKIGFFPCEEEENE